MVTQEQVKEALSYDPDTGIFIWRVSPSIGLRPGSVAGCRHSRGYRQIRLGGKSYLAHRLAWLYVHGEIPDQIDHINHIRDDNRLSNLRPASYSVNNMNKSIGKNNSSGHVGVSWIGANKKWRARIKIHGRDRFLGYFADKECAIKARRQAEQKYGFHENHGAPAACY